MKSTETRMSKSKAFMLSLRVLGYQLKKGDDWAAHCLETDLVGYGANFQKALNNLMELTEMQVSFALQKKKPTLLDHPAPPEIIETYNSLMRTRLQQFTKKSPTDAKHDIACIPLPVIDRRIKSTFVSVQAI